MSSVRQLNLLVIRIALAGIAGLPMLLAEAYLLLGRDRLGIAIGQFGLLVYLTAVNLLVFYFDQFQAIGGAAFQFALLLVATHYRQRYARRPTSSQI